MEITWEFSDLSWYRFLVDHEFLNAEHLKNKLQSIEWISVKCRSYDCGCSGFQVHSDKNSVSSWFYLSTPCVILSDSDLNVVTSCGRSHRILLSWNRSYDARRVKTWGLWLLLLFVKLPKCDCLEFIEKLFQAASQVDSPMKTVHFSGKSYRRATRGGLSGLEQCF